MLLTFLTAFRSVHVCLHMCLRVFWLLFAHARGTSQSDAEARPELARLMHLHWNGRTVRARTPEVRADLDGSHWATEAGAGLASAAQRFSKRRGHATDEKNKLGCISLL